MRKTLVLLTIVGSTLLSQTVFAQAANDQKNVTTANSINEATKLGLSGGVTSIASFSSKEDTKGTRYLSSDWVKGEVTDTAGKVYDNPQYYFNYDKISHDLYLTTDKKEVVQLDHNQIKEFTLSSFKEGKLQFKLIPAIATDTYVESLVESQEKYTLYKLTRTKFEKSNYRSSGLVETGKNYDEYVDTDNYYVGLPGGKEFKKIDLSKKSLKKVFAGNEKAETFMKDHSSEKVDEHFAQALIQSLNS